MQSFVDYLCERAWEVVPVRDGDSSFYSTAEPDDYFYHVTTAPNAKSIMSSGALKPNVKKLMGNGGSLVANSKGRVFVTDRGGVAFWVSRAEDHAFDQYDNPPDVVVLRIPKAVLQNKVVTPDDVGTRDAHAPAYYITGGFTA